MRDKSYAKGACSLGLQAGGRALLLYRRMARGAILLAISACLCQASQIAPYLDPDKPLDYDNLDLSYYPYIIAYNATTDEEIIDLVNSLEASNQKTGVFIGLYGGWIFHNATNDPAYLSGNAYAYGAKVGYQSFYPSLYDRLSIPNIVGSRIYVQYLGSNAKELSYADIGFSGVGVSADILVDLPVAKGLESGAIMGLGLFSMAYDNKPDSSLGGVINLGFDVVIATKHRTEAEIKFIINDKLDWFGVATMVGYSYVF